MKQEKITTLREINETVLICDTCGHKFILTAVILRDKEDYESRKVDLWPQGTVYFCPYCGEEKKK